MWPKLHDEYAGHQWLKGLLHAIAIVDREIFMSKIICAKKIVVLNFHGLFDRAA